MINFECSGDWLVEYADGDLAATDSQQAEAHLAHCPNCSREVAALQSSRERLSAYFAVSDIARPAVNRATLANRLPIALNNAATALASLAAAALLVITFLLPQRTREIVKAIPSPTQPVVDVTAADLDDDVLAAISRETQIARLRMTSEIMAKEPGMNDRHLAIEKYLADVYGVIKVQKPFEM